MPRRFLITGGAGFIGSNFIRFLFENEPDARVTNLDLLTYAGVRSTVAELDTDSRHSFVHGDIRDRSLIQRLIEDHDVVVHLAAETHVDRSIGDPTAFLETNVVGTGVLIEAARSNRIDRFISVSTDEVYGSIPEGAAKEDARLRPSSPYSASKAAADLLAEAYASTHGYAAIISRCTNNYGPYQFPEKIIPLFITNLIDGQAVPLYGDGRHERDWLHVADHCAALHMLVDHGTPGETYNIGADAQVSNLELTRRILRRLHLSDDWIEEVPDRPGHDLRYSVDSTKVRDLGWKPERCLDDGLEETIEWYRSRDDWWRPLKERR